MPGEQGAIGRQRIHVRRPHLRTAETVMLDLAAATRTAGGMPLRAELMAAGEGSQQTADMVAECPGCQCVGGDGWVGALRRGWADPWRRQRHGGAGRR